jgi:tetratricopeptide (TPR) repeat protein
MFLFALLLAQSSALPSFDEVRFGDCQKLIAADPASAIVNASEWRKAGGKYLAEACLAGAYAASEKYAEAAKNFEGAAAAATKAGDKYASRFWSQAGNAAIAGGLTDEAIRYFGEALSAPKLSLQLSLAERAEILIDRARAYVSGRRNEEAASDLTEARRIAPDNALGWLLSATLARRGGKLEDAQNYIVTAAALAPSDASVALEAGNIAAAAGAFAIAKEQWQQVIRIAPQSPQASTAARLLAQVEAQQPETKQEKR